MGTPLTEEKIAVKVDSKIPKRSALGWIRSALNPPTKEQKILERYSAEREIARHSAKNFNERVTLRAYAQIDEHIINAAQGLNQHKFAGCDIKQILSDSYYVADLKNGKNWMGTARKINGFEVEKSVWVKLGKHAGGSAEAEVTMDQIKVREAALSAYKVHFRKLICG